MAQDFWDSLPSTNQTPQMGGDFWDTVPSINDPQPFGNTQFELPNWPKDRGWIGNTVDAFNDLTINQSIFSDEFNKRMGGTGGPPTHPLDIRRFAPTNLTDWLTPDQDEDTYKKIAEYSPTAAEILKQYNKIGQTGLRGAGEFVEANVNPLNIATAATGGLPGIAARAGFTGLARGAQYGLKAADAATAGMGVLNIWDPDADWKQRGMGAVQAFLGYRGARQPVIGSKSSTSIPESPDVRPTTTTEHVGPLNMPGVIDLPDGTVVFKGGNQSTLAVLEQMGFKATGHVTADGPIMARGDTTGIRTNPDGSVTVPLNETSNANIRKGLQDTGFFIHKMHSDGSVTWAEGPPPGGRPIIEPRGSTPAPATTPIDSLKTEPTVPPNIQPPREPVQGSFGDELGMPYGPSPGPELPPSQPPFGHEGQLELPREGFEVPPSQMPLNTTPEGYGPSNLRTNPPATLTDITGQRVPNPYYNTAPMDLPLQSGGMRPSELPLEPGTLNLDAMSSQQIPGPTRVPWGPREMSLGEPAGTMDLDALSKTDVPGPSRIPPSGEMGLHPNLSHLTIEELDQMLDSPNPTVRRDALNELQARNPNLEVSGSAYDPRHVPPPVPEPPRTFMDEVKRFISETRGSMDPEDDPIVTLIRRIRQREGTRRGSWADRPPRTGVHGDERIPESAFQADEGVMSTRELEENPIGNEIPRKAINQRTETDPNRWFNYIREIHPNLVEEASAIYRETSPRQIAENFRRYQAAQQQARAKFNEAAANQSRHGTPIPEEIRTADAESWRLRDLAQAKYEQASFRQLMGRLISDESGTLDIDAMRQRFRQLRDEMRGPGQYEETGRTARFTRPLQNILSDMKVGFARNESNRSFRAMNEAETAIKNETNPAKIEANHRQMEIELANISHSGNHDEIANLIYLRNIATNKYMKSIEMPAGTPSGMPPRTQPTNRVPPELKGRPIPTTPDMKAAPTGRLGTGPKELAPPIIPDTPPTAPPTQDKSLLRRLFDESEGAVDPLQHLKVGKKLGQYVGTGLKEAWELSRALSPTGDFSFALRQGFPLIGTKAWRDSWEPARRALGDRGAYEAVMAELRSRPMFRRDPSKLATGGKLEPSFAEKAGLDITDITGKNREEMMSSVLVNKIPWIKQTNQMFSAYVNSLRVYHFEQLIKDAEGMGLKPRQDRVLAKQIADFVNTGTGRAPLRITSFTGKEHSFEGAANILSNTLFAPRLLMRTARMLNPNTYIYAHPFVRRQYLKAAARTAGAWMAFATMGKVAGADVSLDPTSTDFGKIKIGNFRLDPAGGFQQPIVMLMRNATGYYTTSEGRRIELGKGFRAETRGSLTQRFFENKMHPTAKFIWDLGWSTQYRPVSVGDRAMQSYIPMIAQDAYEIIKENPDLTPLLLPVMLGMGTQTYEPGETPNRFIDKRNDWVIQGGSTFNRNPFRGVR